VGVARAELVVFDVGMGDRVARGRRVGLQGDHVKAMNVACGWQPFPEEAHGKASEVNLFERDGFGDDAEGLGLPIDCQTAKVRIELSKFLQEES
jgi:hypothetical protein